MGLGQLGKRSLDALGGTVRPEPRKHAACLLLPRTVPTQTGFAPRRSRVRVTRKRNECRFPEVDRFTIVRSKQRVPPANRHRPRAIPWRPARPRDSEAATPPNLLAAERPRRALSRSVWEP